MAQDADYEPDHDKEILKQKIIYLEEELLRKNNEIDLLKKENVLLFKTALKNSENRQNKEKQ